MDMTTEIGIFLAYACGFFAVVFLGKLFKTPIKLIGKLLINSLIGFVVIIAINLLGGSLGVCLPLNILTAMLVGVLGLPGIIMIFVINIL